MKISLGSWAFSFGPFAADPIPFDRTVRRLSEAGYDGIELCGFPPHLTLDEYPTRESRREVVRRLEDHRLGVSGYSADFTAVNPVIEENRSRYLDLFRRQVEMCADLGSPALRVDSGAAPGSIRNRDYAAAMDRLASVWREGAEIAAEAGVRVVWEFEPGFVFNKPSEAAALHEKVGHANFTILFDTSHAYMSAVVGARQHGARETLPGGVPQLLRMLQGRIGAVHIIDSDGTLYHDETSRHVPFGRGLIDFRAIAPQLASIPGLDWWCVDMCFCPESWNLVERSLEFVRDLLAQAAAAR
ncbi:MAG: sugar phosphate isomerase/epimerase family protein [Bryobacteraceae bacterium]